MPSRRWALFQDPNFPVFFYSYSQTIDLTTPPSTRNAAPFMDEARGLHMNATKSPISLGWLNRLSKDEGRAVSKNRFSTSSLLIFWLEAISLRKAEAPSLAVGPGSTELTVTFVPAVVSAR